MTKVKFYISDYHACGHVRAEVPARVINSQLSNMCIDVKNSIVMSDFPKTNLMVFQRMHREDVYLKMMQAKENRIKTIYELDDDILNTPEEFAKAYKFYSDPKVRLRIVDFLSNCDAVTVSTPALASSLEAIIPAQTRYIVPNYLDLTEWDDVYRRKLEMDSGKIMIGWMASGSHVLDIPEVRDALEVIMEDHPNVYLHFIGWIGFDNMGLDKYKDRIIVESWAPIHQLPATMGDFDINLCPLIDNKFNRSKSNLKYLQGSALGIPTICSPTVYEECVEDGVDGFIAKDPASWLACLKELVENTDLRKDMGTKARRKVADQYDIRNNYLKWANVFEKVIGG